MGEQDKPTRDSGVWRPMGGEGIQQKASDDDDVEGHAQARGAQRAQTRAIGDDEGDVEGHAQTRGAQRGTPDDDVEGHRQKRDAESAAQRGTPDDDDVEGHKHLQATPGDDEDDVEGHKQTR